MSLNLYVVDTYTHIHKKKFCSKSPDITWSFPVLHKNHPSEPSIHNTTYVLYLFRRVKAVR